MFLREKILDKNVLMIFEDIFLKYIENESKDCLHLKKNKIILKVIEEENYNISIPIIKIFFVGDEIKEILSIDFKTLYKRDFSYDLSIITKYINLSFIYKKYVTEKKIKKANEDIFYVFLKCVLKKINIKDVYIQFIIDYNTIFYQKKQTFYDFEKEYCISDQLLLYKMFLRKVFSKRLKNIDKKDYDILEILFNKYKKYKLFCVYSPYTLTMLKNIWVDIVFEDTRNKYTILERYLTTIITKISQDEIDKIYHKYLESVLAYIENNKLLFSKINKNVMHVKIINGLYFEGEKEYIDVMNSFRESDYLFNKYIQSKYIPKYVYMHKNGIVLCKYIVPIKNNDINIYNNILLDRDKIIFILDNVAPLFIKSLQTIYCVKKHEIFLIVLYMAYFNASINDLSIIAKNILYSIEKEDLSNIEVNEYILGKKWLEIKKSFPLLAEKFMFFDKNIYSLYLDILHNIKLVNILNPYIDFKIDKWARYIDFTYDETREKMSYFSIKDLKIIYVLTDPKIASCFISKDNSKKILSLLLCVLFYKYREYGFKNDYNNFNNIPINLQKNIYDEWNQILSWFYKNRKDIFQSELNTIYKVNDFFDYIYADNKYFSEFNIKKFNFNMSFKNAFYNYIMYHNVFDKIDDYEQMKYIVFKKNDIHIYEENNIKIEQLLTGRCLLKEGSEMHHCVGQYIDKVKNNISIIFKITDKKDIYNRGTLEIEKINGKFIIKQLRSFYNKEVSDNIKNIVKNYIDILNK